MIRRVLLGVALAIVGLLCLPALPPVARELVLRLPLGWLAFLRRTWPEVTWNWPGIGMVVLCSGLLLVGLHSLGGWLYTAARGTHPGSGPVRWPWRWTGAIFGAFWLLFVLVMGASGLGRQLTWLADYDGPLYEERRSGWAELTQADGALATAFVEHPSNATEALMAFRRGDYEPTGSKPTLWEQHHVLLFTNASGGLAGYVIFPRNPSLRERTGFLASGAEVVSRSGAMTNLPAVIARLERRAR